MAMPWSEGLARGGEGDRSSPSTLRLPSLCGCSPDMILMRVDLPAPLSPSTQVDLAGVDAQVDAAQRADRAVGLADVVHLDQRLALVQVAVGVLGEGVGHGQPTFRRGGEPLDVEVDQHGEQQHHAEEGLEPVGVPAGVDDAEAGHAEDERADRDADRVAVAAGEQRAADDRGDDVEELVADAVAGLQRVEPVEGVHADEPAEERHRHEQADLRTQRPARRPRGRWPALPPTAKIQLPIRVRCRIQADERDEQRSTTARCPRP